MALISIDASGVESENIATIKEKTGVIIETTSTSKQYSIKFPNMETSQNVMSNAFSGSGYVFYIDVDNDFLILLNPVNSLVKPSGVNYTNLITTMIYNVGGLLKSTYTTSTSGIYFDVYFNLPQYVSNKANINDYIIYPSFFSPSSSRCDLIPNLYFHCNYPLTVGLKFKDQNNNSFISFGGNMLYKLEE